MRRVVQGPQGQQGSIEWLALRRTKITATDVAAILGVDPYRTSAQVYDDKLYSNPVQLNDHMRRGLEKEPYVRQFFSDKYHCHYEPAVITNDAYPWLMVSLDGWDEKAKYPILEAKAPKKMPIAINHSHYIQMQTQMLCCDMEYAIYGVIVEDQIEEMICQRDPHLSLQIKDATSRFHERLINFESPESEEWRKIT